MRVSILVRTFLLVLALTASSCAGIGYNRYQTAHAMGKGQIKATASVEACREMVWPMGEDIMDRMSDEMRSATRDYIQSRPTEEERQKAAAALWAYENADIHSYEWKKEYGLLPAVAFAYGVTDKVDLEAGVTALGGVRADAKIELTRFGNGGALAIAPGTGYQAIDTEFSSYAGNISLDPIYDNYLEVKDHVRGYIVTLEAPLLVGWQVAEMNYYIGLLNTYHHVPIEVTRTGTIFNKYLNRDFTIKPTYHFYQTGLILGMQLHPGKFVMDLEIVTLYSFNDAGPGPIHDDADRLYVLPGLSMGAQW